MASAKLGNGDEAAEFFHMLNPINHTRSGPAMDRYKAEPYVLAGDVYSNPLHRGRAGWSWYTGADPSVIGESPGPAPADISRPAER